MKNLKIIISLIVIIGIAIVLNFLFFSKFHSGECVKDNRDGYIWNINYFSFGKYRIMGWQGGAWGNAVEMDRDVLERKDIDGIQIYNKTACPEYNSK